MLIQTELREEGRVALLTLRNPPVNSLSAALRGELLAAIDAALANEAVRALVLAGEGDFFCCGAEIREFNTPLSTREPTLRALIARIERAAKPVVAAIHGAALGGGLELALGCHYRLVLAGASLGLPEVKLGVLPGAGGTQRLPRLVGVERALSMICGGDPVDARLAAEWGLVDEVCAKDLIARATAYALAVADAPLEPRVVGARPVRSPV
ncbi:enoyl-CoA hydratase-related protein, partial [Bordetella pseudohinzii]|uniref:enoyl-CoA hydratase-related protein n=1 Tax=Bordetella pseudohinzii TaxID=1331258 RepID=UPI00191866D2